MNPNSLPRALHRAVLSSTHTLLSHIHRLYPLQASLQASELSSLRQASRKPLPPELKGLLDVTTPSLLQYVRTASRRLSETHAIPQLSHLPSEVAFAALRHLSTRIGALQSMHVHTASQSSLHGISIISESHFQRASTKHFFSYSISITNASENPVQFLSRNMQLRELCGRVTSVNILGINGEFPVLKPGSTMQFEDDIALPGVATKAGSVAFVMPKDEAKVTTLTVPLAPFSFRVPPHVSLEPMGVVASAESGSAKKKRRKRRRR